MKILKRSELERMAAAALAPTAEGPAVSIIVSPREEGTVSQRSTKGVRLSFRLPESLHRRLKMHAVVTGATIVGTVASWVEEHTRAA